MNGNLHHVRDLHVGNFHVGGLDLGSLRGELDTHIGETLLLNFIFWNDN